jgi:predicted nucleic acid-binding protein
LLSEDFSHGRKYGSVQVVNPFYTDPNELFGE